MPPAARALPWTRRGESFPPVPLSRDHIFYLAFGARGPGASCPRPPEASSSFLPGGSKMARTGEASASGGQGAALDPPGGIIPPGPPVPGPYFLPCLWCEGSGGIMPSAAGGIFVFFTGGAAKWPGPARPRPRAWPGAGRPGCSDRRARRRGRGLREAECRPQAECGARERPDR